MVRTALRPFALLTLACALAAGHATPARAAGFLIYDLTGEALGKGSAVSASTTEPAAILFNPAALAFMPGYQASVGSVIIYNVKSFTPAPELGGPKVTGDRGTFVLPTAFATAKVSDRVALGMGAYPLFGLGISWPENWVGRESAIDAKIQTFDFNPTLAVTLIPDTLSLGVGYQGVRATVDFKNALPESVGGTVRIGGATWGHGFNAALLYRPVPDVLHFAFTYRSRVKLDFKGRADFDPDPEFASALPDQKGTSAITLPDILTLGVMWRPIPSLTLNFDPHYVMWSTYDELRLGFETRPEQVLVRKNKNVFTLRTGADWTNQYGLALRAGFIYDQNPAPSQYLSPSLPDADRLDFGLGFGITRGWLRADVGYLLVYFLPSKATNPKDPEAQREGPAGTYRSTAHLIGLTVTGRFGAGSSRR